MERNEERKQSAHLKPLFLAFTEETLHTLTQGFY